MEIKHNHVEDMEITDVLSTNYMPYAASVIIGRALPAIDGFKPSHRKALYTMYKMGLMNQNLVKSSNAVGEIMKLHPHGDATIYETIVRMTDHNEALRYPYVKGKGSFGKHYSSEISYAHHRYTEVTLDKYCEVLFNDIDKNTVEFVDNFDNTLKEPTLLPTMYPSILTTNTDGIAVAMTSTICSFNLVEICNFTKAWINSKTKRINPLTHIKGPDFPYGGVFIDDGESLEKVLKTGRGSLKVRGKYHINKKKREIIFTEIPYTTTVEEIMKDISKNAQGNVNNKNNKMPGIREVRDDIDRKGLKFVVGYKQGYDYEEVLGQLFHYTKLEDSIHCNFNILRSDGYPKVMGVSEIIEEWYNFRVSVVENRTKHQLDKIRKDLHLMYGLMNIIDDIDKVIKIIRSSKNKDKARESIMKKYKLDEIQANYVLSIPIGNLNEEYIKGRVKNIKELEEEAEELEAILKDKDLLDKEIIKDINYVVRKYGDERRTSIMKEEDIIYYDPEDYKVDHENLIFITDDNYIKKVRLEDYDPEKENVFKEGDVVEGTFKLKDSSELICITNKENAYKIVVEDIEPSRMRDIGEYAYNLIEAENDEEIIFIFGTNDFSEEILVIYEDGTGIRIELDNYKTKTRRSCLKNSLNQESKPIYISLLEEPTNLLINLEGEGGILLDTNIIPSRKSRNPVGVRVANMKKNSKISHVEEVKNPVKLESLRVDKIPSTPIKG